MIWFLHKSARSTFSGDANSTMVQKGGKSHGIEKHAVRNIKLPPELRALTFARALVTSLPFAYLQEKVGYALWCRH